MVEAGTKLPGSAEELVSVKRSILDIVVVQQQKRIMELEEKLRRRKEEMVLLQREKGRFEAQQQSVAASPMTPGSPSTPPMVTTSMTPKIEEPSKIQAISTPVVSTPKVGNKPIAKKAKSAPLQSPQFNILPRYWTEDEHRKFLEGRKIYGPKNYAAISVLVGTRTPKQVRTHAQKYEMRLVRESAMRSFLSSRDNAQDQLEDEDMPSESMSEAVVPEAIVPETKAEKLLLDEEIEEVDNLFAESRSMEVPQMMGMDDLDNFLNDDFNDDLKLEMEEL
mmetsp:Transcript_11470/g.35047  ORF Transcript_11470/g.35047 Transcript_11470/m.35047 type:complete len:278 (+) Transcript_11470:86-919(+)|eukprot:CAMPEP_0198723812 /NCGR_PEP_ID=MMETSP1475-20131203/1321_1 /TAXON_ID= ORGANISM="Unidentified sp., Strain CCMP1999" /NCGR_SAMPLE_ID=MMETSP1475 /ASSEMBLY_ACC=CAM_ASM_001111 /LENGTH=277 /DNA_ID=CAMNT_0044485103 /DNA_START=16 /DNA_END=849 /DNA_ORIENTATION=+